MQDPPSNPVPDLNNLREPKSERNKQIRFWELHELGEIHHVGPVNQPKGAVVVFGGQAGSEGKGAIAGYLARNYVWGAAIANFGPNTGHTFTDDNGTEYVVSQLPISVVGPVPRILMGPQSVIDVGKMLHELAWFENRLINVADRLTIHPRASIVTDEHKEWEAENLRYISSTGKGNGAALADKVRRVEGVKLARDVPALKPYLGDTAAIVNETINNGLGVLVEQAQGFDLDMNFGFEYPYCTGRQTTPQQALADACIDGRLCTHNIAVIRTYPIRVGSVEGYTSGGYGSKELNWNEMARRTGSDEVEVTTVTKRPRRIFEFDFDRISIMSDVCRPTEVALTFADYIDPAVANLRGTAPTHCPSETVRRFIFKLEQRIARGTMSPKVTMMKTGPLEQSMFSRFGP